MNIVEMCGECGSEISARVRKDVWAIRCPECGKKVFLCDKCYDEYAVVDKDGYVRTSDRPCECGGVCPAERYLKTHKI